MVRHALTVNDPIMIIVKVESLAAHLQAMTASPASVSVKKNQVKAGTHQAQMSVIRKDAAVKVVSEP